MLLNPTNILFASLALVIPLASDCDCEYGDPGDPDVPQCNRYYEDCDDPCPRWTPPGEESESCPPNEDYDPCEWYDPGYGGCPEEDPCKYDPKKYGCPEYDPCAWYEPGYGGCPKEPC